jgi:ADP-ribose pyrophosphatase YjhB (NUDIX family)
MASAKLSLQFCGWCGKPAEQRAASNESCARIVCEACGHTTIGGKQHASPALLVLVLIFAQEELLLIKRGIPPFEGKWAAPGGFVEAGESLESTAIREVREEVGVELPKESLIPHAIISLPRMNQVYVTFIACIDKCALHPTFPEALDARWFPETQFPHTELWGGRGHFEIGRIFDRIRRGRFEIYQQSDDFLRVYSRGECQYLWRAR